jgi:hypothetical protein
LWNRITFEHGDVSHACGRLSAQPVIGWQGCGAVLPCVPDVKEPGAMPRLAPLFSVLVCVHEIALTMGGFDLSIYACDSLFELMPSP